MKPVIILGMGYSRAECPYDVETWGCNESYLFAKRLDRTYISDSFDQFNTDHFVLLAGKFKIYTRPDNVAIGKRLGLDVVKIPLEEMIAHFKTRYFTNTICYMLAHALYEGYDKISLYGIDHLTYTSYTLERGGVEYWIGRAQEKIGADNVIIARGSALLHTVDDKLYGYELKYDRVMKSVERFLV